MSNILQNRIYDAVRFSHNPVAAAQAEARNMGGGLDMKRFAKAERERNARDQSEMEMFGLFVENNNRL